jgi:hypothetical protein
MADSLVSQSELLRALDDLILQEVPPQLAPDDITIALVAERAQVNDQKAKRMIKRWQADGRVEYLGQRRGNHGQLTQAWRLKA